jgi:gamma-butyrobetaine dioxygenase
MLDSVYRLGFAIVDHIPTSDKALFEVIDLFGYVRETNYGRLFDVRVEPNPSNMAFTSSTLSAHTDNPYRNPVPGLQLLHVLENSAEGGENTLVDGLWVAELMRREHPRAFEVLSSTEVDFRFQSDDADLHNRTTLIGVDHNGDANAVRFNNRSMQALDLPADDTHEFYAAHQLFSHLLEDDHHRVMFKLAAGEAMLFDNTRILHGRLGYAGGGQRHLQGCYADMDSLLSKLRVLQRKTTEPA